MSQPNGAQAVKQPDDSESNRRFGADGAFRHDIIAIFALGLVVALTCRGHFVVPHADFHEFLDSGHALLSGELPPTMKRGPVYGVLVVALGRLLPVELADRVAAEWLNVLLLPLNALLIYLIGRRWFGGAARWAAAWFVILPFSLYCTAHVFAEPLLTFFILLTVLAVQRGSGWGYAAAALATMTRYDAAGLIAGVLIADLLRKKPLRRALWQSALTATPLVLWLILTARTWSTRWQDHYISQIAERPQFDLAWSLRAPLRAVFDVDPLRLPALLLSFGGIVRSGLAWALLVAAVVGLAVTLRRKGAAAVTGAVAYFCYVLVHAIFPFQMERFGYPLAPLVILAAGAGIHAVAARIAARSSVSRPVWLLVAGVVGVFVVGALVGEANVFRALTGVRNPWSVSLVFLVVVAMAVLWSAPMQVRGGRTSQTLILLTMALATSIQIRSSLERMGSGRNMPNRMHAALWIRDHAPPDARVLAPSPGLLRLYVAREPRDRFLTFQDIEAETWPEILAECRRRKITYIIWHDQLYQMHGEYYWEKRRLSRFDVLAKPQELEGVVVERWYANFPNLVIVRVEW